MHAIMRIGEKLPIYTAIVDVECIANGLDHASATAEEIDKSGKRSVECQLDMISLEI